MFRKHGIFYTVCLTPAAKTRALIGFIAKKYYEEKNLSSEKIRHTSMVNTWKIKKNFLPSTFSVIAILRYPTFPYCFYYIAILQLSVFWEIFTRLLVISAGMYLEMSNFLRFSLASIGISWWKNFWNQLHRLTARGHQSVVGRAKNETIFHISE